MAQSLAQFERRIAMVSKEFDGTAGRERMRRVGKATQGDVDDAVRATLGDLSMSGWTRSRPANITGVSRVVGDGAVFISAGKASGQMRVLQDGRNQGNAGGMAGPGVSADGTTRRTKSGRVAKARTRKAKRWNGRTEGKGTWDKAADLMADRVPGRIAAETHKALARHLTGG